MKIVLINPFIDENFTIHFPLGIAYLASILINAGHEVAAWDFHTSPCSDEEIRKMIKNTASDLFGITSMIRTIRQVKNIIKLIREEKPEVTVVVGGAGATSMPATLIDYFNADYLMTGECERSILSFIQFLEGKSNPADVDGLCWRQSEKIILNRRPELIDDLDQIPFPAWDIFDIDAIKFKNAFIKNESDKTTEFHAYMSMIASRGCPYRCSYCDHSIKGYRLRQRSVENVIEEIKRLQHEYDVRNLYFWDDIFLLDHQWVRSFCDSLAKFALDIKWTCNGHVNHGNVDIYKRMKEAGCTSIRIGIESGSQKILNSLNKGVRVQDALQTVREITTVGIVPVLYIMLGMIDETEEDLNATIDFLRQTGEYVSLIGAPPTFEVFFLTPFPGTPLFDQAVIRGFIKDESYILDTLPDCWSKLAINMTAVPVETVLNTRKIIDHEIRDYLFQRQKLIKQLILDMGAEAGLK